ncbi:MAG: hypothetical protein ACREYE_11565 [Gammaproteobacteria bacterium]
MYMLAYTLEALSSPSPLPNDQSLVGPTKKHYAPPKKQGQKKIDQPPPQPRCELKELRDKIKETFGRFSYPAKAEDLLAPIIADKIHKACPPSEMAILDQILAEIKNRSDVIDQLKKKPCNTITEIDDLEIHLELCRSPSEGGPLPVTVSIGTVATVVGTTSALVFMGRKVDPKKWGDLACLAWLKKLGLEHEFEKHCGKKPPQPPPAESKPHPWTVSPQPEAEPSQWLWLMVIIVVFWWLWWQNIVRRQNDVMRLSRPIGRRATS